MKWGKLFYEPRQFYLKACGSVGLLQYPPIIPLDQGNQLCQTTCEMLGNYCKEFLKKWIKENKQKLKFALNYTNIIDIKYLCWSA